MVTQKTLSNGLTVLVHELHHLPKVSINLWYGVGSKHEKSDEKGLAHLIEHMIFKGTQKLSEVDIDTVTQKLSGYTNAFTSYDYTCYLFDVPSHSLREPLFILADTMRNCRFEEQMLNSELSAVVQELKLYKDDYFDLLVSRMCGAIFNDHPYRYPIIGFKQDLWNLQREALVAFYKKHYVPNNAVLVVVGDVKAEDVFRLAEELFGAIPADLTFKKREFYLSRDLLGQSVTLYRDIQQPQVALSYLLPGATTKKRFLFEVLAGIIGKGKCSRLYTKLVDELELVSELHCAIDQREDATLLDITFQPFDSETTDHIISLIQQELDTIAKFGVTEHELQRACKQVKASLLSVFENISEQALLIGESFLLTGDAELIFKEFEKSEENLAADIQTIVATYCLSFYRHEGRLLAMTDLMIKEWTALQELSDEEDKRILAGRVRTTTVEKPHYALQLIIPKMQKWNFFEPTKTELSNGLTLLAVNNPIIPKIDLVLSLSFKEYADPEDKQGLYRLICDLLLEGTRNYPGNRFADEVERLGMTLTCEPGVLVLSMLKEDFERGLEFVKELMVNADFTQKSLTKVKEQILADLSMYWDEPQDFAQQLVREVIYNGHPYSKNPQGTIEGIEASALEDVKAFYKKLFIPDGADLALVGDLTGYDVPALVESYLGSWSGSKTAEVATYEFTALPTETIVYPINRDQVVLLFASRSISRLHPDYEALLLFDQILSGGAQGSMTSRLMMIREQTGLFYGIGGSLIAGCDEQPGMVLVKTTVSLDRLQEAEKVILATLHSVIDSLTQEELDQAKSAMINGLIDNFSSNKKIAGAFLGIERFKLPADYFNTFEERILTISLQQVQEAAARVLQPDKLVKIVIGRVGE